MRVHQQTGASGFTAVEAVLVIVVLAAVVGVGIFVVHREHAANTTANTQAAAPAGTSASVDQLTQQDAQTEAAVDGQGDSQVQQDALSANSAVSNVGGAYNESTL